MTILLSKLLEQAMGRSPLAAGAPADENDLAQDITTAKENDPQLANLLTRKQNLTANINKIQDQIKELDVQIAQRKASVEEPERS